MKRLRVCLCLMCVAAVCCLAARPAGAGREAMPLAGKRVLLVNSYHPGYAWSDGIVEGARAVLEPQGVVLRMVNMDTKRNQGEAFLKEAGRKAMAEVRAFRPDVVIACDDNAQRWFVVPFLLGGPIPVVFCGVNWDAAQYGYPAANVTGMVEVEVLGTLMDHLRRFAKGDRVGFLGDDTESERQIFANYDRQLPHGTLRPYFVKDFAAFKAAFLAAQQQCDMLILSNNSTLRDWDDAEAQRIVAAHGTVPTGTYTEWLAPYVVFTTAKVAQEQGEWAAGAALRILRGESPAAIPLVRNEKARLIVNVKMAQGLGIVIPVATLKAASEVLGKDALREGGPARPGAVP